MSDIITDRYSLLLGDCLERLKSIESNSVDALVTDPPAGISFMGKDWDSDKGGSKEWINWLSQVMHEVQRVLKPGAHGFIWALPRTSHWTAMAIEWGGLEIRDCVTHLFGNGFPKASALNRSKSVAFCRCASDKHSNESTAAPPLNASRTDDNPALKFSAWSECKTCGKPLVSGWYSGGLKPAAEFWWSIRKQISEESIAANVLKWGTGAINIDVSRVDGTVGGVGRVIAQGDSQGGWGAEKKGGGLRKPIFDDTKRGRFPANLVLSHTTDCVLRAEGKRAEGKRVSTDFGGNVREREKPIKYDDSPDIWDCHPECPVAILDGQSGRFPGLVGAKQTGSFEFHAGIGGQSGKGMIGGKKDFGGASRFFYTAKPSTWERDAGLSEIPEGKARSAIVSCNGQGDQRLDGKPIATRRNVHPTVKSFALMRYLINMITPPGGTVLDCFLGSGTTGAVAVACGFRFIGIEREPEYLEIARRRIADVRLQPEPTNK